MKKSSTETDPLNEELDTDVNQERTPEIHILKGKKRGHKRDGCNGGSGSNIGGGFDIGIGPALAAFKAALRAALLAGSSPTDIKDFEIVKAKRDIPAGTILKDKDMEGVSALGYTQSGGTISKDMLTRSMAKNLSTTKNIPKGTLFRINMLTRTVTAVH